MPNRLTRRQALQLLGGLSLGSGLAPAASLTEKKKRPPNILFILTDDQAFDAIGFTGRFDFLPTPHMDRLARQGARFNNAFVTTSLCSPSRASFLTGCYAHRHGVTANGSRDLHPTTPTFAELLQQAGYQTAFVGKWHMRPTSAPRPGFDYWLGFRGQGKYNNPELNENGRQFVKRGYMTDILTDYATAWLRRPRRKPFCLCLWHKAVHGPFTPAPRHANFAPHAGLPKPPSFDDTFVGKPKWLRRGFRYGTKRHDWTASQEKPIPESIPPARWQPHNPGRLNYLRSLLAVDESVGRLLETLQQIGQLDNTFIVFSSDNGYFLGEHRRGDKRLMYEESIRIPLLVRYPPLIKPGTTVEQMALNIDLAPTLLALAGLPAPAAVQGRSLLPLLRGDRIEWRQAFLYEYFQEGWLPGIPTMVGVRTHRYKYIHYPDLHDDIDELYDLRNDPHELSNLAAQPAHARTLAKMKTELATLKSNTGYRRSLDAALTHLEVPLELVLHYNFARLQGGKVPDQSGQGHHGSVHNAKIVRGDGAGALALNAPGFVQVDPVPETLNPQLKPLTVGGFCRPHRPDGALVSFGGQSRGFCLYLQQGRPHLAVRSAGDLGVISGPRALTLDEPVHLAGVLTSDARLRLYVNGRRVAQGKAPDFLPGKPNESFMIGADNGTLVGDYRRPLYWRGLIYDVRLYWGELNEDQLRRWANPQATGKNP